MELEREYHDNTLTLGLPQYLNFSALLPWNDPMVAGVVHLTWKLNLEKGNLFLPKAIRT